MAGCWGARLVRAVTYGQRFRELRRHLWTAKGKTVLALAERLESKYAATIYNIERQWRVPLLPTLLRHADALGCQPWDLLINVETEYDLVRRLATLRPADAERRLRALVRRYTEWTDRAPKSDTSRKGRAGSAGKRDGAALALRDDADQGDPVPRDSRPAYRRARADLERLTRDAEQQAAQLARSPAAPGLPGEHAAAPRDQAAGRSARARKSRR